MVFFSIASIGVLIPFLNILFDQQPLVEQGPEAIGSVEDIILWFNFQFSEVIMNSGKSTAMMYMCFGLMGVFFFKNMFRYFAMFFMAPVRNGIVRDIRQDLFHKVLGLPLSFFSEQKKGNLMSIMATDVQEIEWSILNVLEVIVREPLLIIGALGFMLYISPSLTGFVFILLIFITIIIGGIGKFLKKTSSKVQENLGVLVSQIEEGISGLRIIKSFNAQAFQEERFLKENNEYRWLLTRLLWRKDLSSPLTEFLGVATVSVLIWYGFNLVQSDELKVTTFLTFLYAFFTIIEPAKKFSTASYNIQKGMAAVDRVNRIMEAPITIANAPNAQSITQFNDKIDININSFAYPNTEVEVLKDINLTIHQGEIVALVGSSGAGKSTIADLLPRFYDIKDLRQLMGVVSQEAILFNDSIYNNIVFGMEGVTEAEVIAAAKIANAHDFIQESANGYQTNIGDRGTKLSGGQRQRLTIARAILKNPPILILDEATSALDSESERLVQDALEKLMQNRTSIVIAHRLSTIQHAHKIVVMKKGEIVEIGTHYELINKKGEYFKLVELQGL